MTERSLIEQLVKALKTAREAFDDDNHPLFDVLGTEDCPIRAALSAAKEQQP